MIVQPDIEEIRTLTDPNEVNRLLRYKDEYWELLDVTQSDGKFVFLLARTFDAPCRQEGTE